MTPSQPDDILISHAVELTHTGGPGLASEGLVDGDEVAALLTSREAGGAAVRGGVLRVGGYIANALLGAVGAAFLFRHLGTKGVGIYVTALSIAAIVGGVSDLGLTALGLRELSVRDPEGRARLMRNLLGLRTSLTLVGIAASVVFSIAVGYSSLLVTGVLLAGIGLLLQNIQGTLGLSLMSRLRLGIVTVTELARQLLSTALTIAFVAAGAGVLTFIGIPIPLGVAFVILTAWLVRREVPLLPSFNRLEWRALAREVLPYSAALALSIVYFRLSVIVVSLTSSATQLGYFSTSFRFIEMLIVVPGLMVTGVFPIFARSALDNQARFAYAVSRVFVVTLIVGVWFALALALGASVAIAVIAGHQFDKAVPVLQIQAIGLGGTFLSALWGMVLLSLRRNRELVLVSLAALIAGTALIVPLASAYGARGAALGTAITEVGLGVLVPLVLLKTDRHVVPSLGSVPRVALAAGLAASVAIIPGLPTVAMVAAASVIYAVAVVVLRAVPEELVVELRRLFERYRRWRAVA